MFPGDIFATPVLQNRGSPRHVPGNGTAEDVLRRLPWFYPVPQRRRMWKAGGGYTVLLAKPAAPSIGRALPVLAGHTDLLLATTPSIEPGCRPPFRCPLFCRTGDSACPAVWVSCRGRRGNAGNPNCLTLQPMVAVKSHVPCVCGRSAHLHRAVCPRP